MLLKQEALQQRNTQWEALNSEGRLGRVDLCGMKNKQHEDKV